MLAKKYRLNVQSVLRTRGSLVRGRYLSLKILPPKEPYARIAVVVASSVDKRSTRRNALKRSLYAAASGFIKGPGSPVDLVVALQNSAAKASLDEVAGELKKLLSQIRT